MVMKRKHALNIADKPPKWSRKKVMMPLFYISIRKKRTYEFQPTKI
jgi:hypothetical protein